MSKRLSVVFAVAGVVSLAVIGVVVHRAIRRPPPHRVRPAVVPLVAPARADVAILPTVGADPGDSLRAIVTRDLGLSGWVRIVPADSVAAAFAAVRMTVLPRGVRVQWSDPPTGAERWSEDFIFPADPMWRRRAVHAAADRVAEWVTGHRGIASTRVVYVSRGELRVVDADGANDSTLRRGGRVLSPAWRHDGTAVLYSDMSDWGTQIAELDLRTGVTTAMASTPRGMNITPAYSPDDRLIVFAHYGDRGTELVVVPRDSATVPGAVRDLQRVAPGDASSPTFSPDGSRIAFASARARTPQIYSVRTDGTDERLETPVTPGVRSYRASPDWSPDGRFIAFEQQNGDLQVWLLSLADRSLRRLTSVGENEGPSWAPDGRHLAIASTRGGAKDVWVVDIVTGEWRQLTRNGSARLPAWSPRLP